MNKSVKILMTIVAVFVYIIVATPVLAGMKEQGMSTGLVGIILLAALIGGLKAIWSKANNNGEIQNKSDDNSSTLQK